MTFLKAFVLLLVLANIGYFLYVDGIVAPPPSPANTGAAAPLASLQLVAEVRPPSAAVAPEPRCVSIGPFADVAAAAHAESTLHGGGYAPRQRAAEGEVADGTWVYLPLPATPAAVTTLIAKLKVGGIADVLSMPGPNDTPVISLGVFSEAPRALARVAQAQKLGFMPSTLERKHTGTVYWVDVDLKPDDGPLNPEDLHVEPARNARLVVETCPVASTAPPTPSAASAASAASVASGAAAVAASGATP